MGSQDDVTAVLPFVSPLYAALNPKLPVELNIKALEFGTRLFRPLFVTVTVDTGLPEPMQEPSGKTLYVTVPFATTWESQAASEQLVVRVAESVTDPPTVIVVADRLVVRFGAPGLTVSGSHGLVAG